MTDTDLIAQADAALDGVTEGPWDYVEAQPTDGQEWSGCGVVAEAAGEFVWMEDDPHVDIPTCRFIGASRQLVPALRDALAAALVRAEAAEAERDKANAEWAEAQSAATYNAEYVDLALDMRARVQALEAEKEQASLAAWRAAFETAADIAERRINAGRAESVPESLRVQARIGQPEEYRATLTGEAGG